MFGRLTLGEAAASQQQQQQQEEEEEEGGGDNDDDDKGAENGEAMEVTAAPEAAEPPAPAPALPEEEEEDGKGLGSSSPTALPSWATWRRVCQAVVVALRTWMPAVCYGDALDPPNHAHKTATQALICRSLTASQVGG